LLCDPESHDDLELNAVALLNPKSSRRYPIRDGIPIFFDALSRSNKKYQELYDRIALFYDPAETLYRWLFRKRDLRAEYLNELEVGAIVSTGNSTFFAISSGIRLGLSRMVTAFCQRRLSFGLSPVNKLQLVILTHEANTPSIFRTTWVTNCSLLAPSCAGGRSG